MEQNNVQLVTLEKSCAHPGSWLPPRDSHFILFIACPGTQTGCSEELILGSLGSAS